MAHVLRLTIQAFWLALSLACMHVLALGALLLGRFHFAADSKLLPYLLAVIALLYLAVIGFAFRAFVRFSVLHISISVAVVSFLMWTWSLRLISYFFHFPIVVEPLYSRSPFVGALTVLIFIMTFLGASSYYRATQRLLIKTLFRATQ